ncbi:MAG TPA: hypothetical protein VNA14_10935 [Mycobacteriales bacterium]|nr:hypothetical protein [Mycobacteriales bacterium]
MLASEAIRRASLVGGRADLRQVRLWGLELDQHHAIPSEGTWDVDVDITAGSSVHDNTVIARIGYSVGVDMSTGEEPRGYQIKTSWLLYYELTSTEGLEQLDYESFAAVSGVFACHPYQRELVQRLTGQMGYEPLVMSVLRSPTEIRDGEDFEVGGPGTGEASSVATT